MKYKINLFLLFCLLTSFSFAQNKAEEFTLNDIVKGKFYAKSVYGLMSMNNGVNYTTLNNRKSIVEYSYKTGDKVKTIFNLDNFKSLKIKAIDDYSFNSDETQILLVTQKNKFTDILLRLFTTYSILKIKLLNDYQKENSNLQHFHQQKTKLHFL